MTQLEHDRSVVGIAPPTAGPHVFDSSPPRTAPPIASVATGIASPSAVDAPTPAAGDPLANLPPQLDPALTLGLFAISRDTYRRLFVDDYPTTVDGVNLDYGSRLARAGLGGGVDFPIRALAGIAADGDEVAYAKLLEASSIAKGRIADTYGEAIAKLAARDPGRLLPLLVRLPMGTRLAVVSLEAGWCRTPPTAVVAGAPDDPAQLALDRALRVTERDCADGRARARARRHHAGSGHGKHGKTAHGTAAHGTTHHSSATKRPGG